MAGQEMPDPNEVDHHGHAPLSVKIAGHIPKLPGQQDDGAALIEFRTSTGVKHRELWCYRRGQPIRGQSLEDHLTVMMGNIRQGQKVAVDKPFVDKVVNQMEAAQARGAFSDL